MSKLLAIETTGKQGSIAFSESETGGILLSLSLTGSQRSTQSLVPTIQSGLSELGWSPRELAHIAVAIGPGSFTGLRVGITTARMLAYVTGAALLGVNTLQAIAATIPISPAARPTAGQDTFLGAAMDAQRGDLSVQFFRQIPDEIPEPVSRIELFSSDNWWEKTGEFEKIIVAGPILSKILKRKPENVIVAEENLWNPTASGVTLVAWSKILRHQIDDIWQLQPFYSRLSAAEEKRLQIPEKSQGSEKCQTPWP